MELDGDAQVHVRVQRIPVGDERPRVRTAGDRLEDGGLDLEEAARVEGSAQRPDHRAAGSEMTALHHAAEKVEVTLAVSRLLVLEAVVLLRGRLQGLDQQGDLRRGDSGLTPPRSHDVAADADDVAEVEEPHQRKCPLADQIEAQPHLKALLFGLDVEEAAPALQPDLHHPAGDAHLGAEACGPIGRRGGSDASNSASRRRAPSRSTVGVKSTL